MPADYHTHTPLCHHAEGSPSEYVEAAIAAGLEEYGITDHAPQVPEPFDDWRMSMADLPRYLDWIAEARDHAAGRIKVLAGLECDWLPNCHSHIDTLNSIYEWDYLIGSVHYLPSTDTKPWDFDNPIHLSRWNALSATELEEIWTTYWSEYTEMVKSDLFDIHGHPDLIKKFARRPEGNLQRFYEPVVDALVDTGKAIEINTAGWHKPCAEQYPTLQFLELAASAGVALTINSDAHHPNEVGRDFDKAYALARKADFPKLALFEQREMRFTEYEPR